MVSASSIATRPDQLPAASTTRSQAIASPPVSTRRSPPRRDTRATAVEVTKVTPWTPAARCSAPARSVAPTNPCGCTNRPPAMRSASRGSASRNAAPASTSTGTPPAPYARPLACSRANDASPSATSRVPLRTYCTAAPESSTTRATNSS